MDMDMLIFGHAGYPVILFPTSLGHYNENKDFKLIDSAAWFIEQGLIKIYCVDGVDQYTFYNKQIHPAERIRNYNFYDKYIRDEVIPLAQHETGHSYVATAGCSFGGYHATNCGFKHPDVVRYIINMSAKFDIKPQLNGFYSDEVYFNNPIDYLPNLQDNNLRDMYVFLGTGTEDMCWQANEDMAAILRSKEVPHWLDVRPGAKHDWPIWREMFPHYLSMIK
jgi:esterase/lipase superfamily enzyme